MLRAHNRAFEVNCDTGGEGPTANSVDEKHLVKARLDTIKDCIDVAHTISPFGLTRERLLDFLAVEQTRLNPKRAAKRGKATK